MYGLLNNNTVPHKKNNWLPSYGLDPFMVLVFVAQIYNIGEKNVTVKMFYHVRNSILSPT
jgi:hypothetical protein